MKVQVIQHEYTVRELIEVLRGCDEDARVAVHSNGGLSIREYAVDVSGEKVDRVDLVGTKVVKHATVN